MTYWLTVSIHFVPRHVESAIEEVATERQRTSAERDAFSRFANQVASLDFTSAQTISTHQPRVTHTIFQPESQLDATLAHICDIYRKTVMSVPHYDEEYGESLHEHLAKEFEPEVAVALTSGNYGTLQLRDQLITESRTAATSRSKFLTALAAEANALEDAGESLSELGNRFSDLFDTREFESWSTERLTHALQKLHACERECEELAADRQTTLHKSRLPGTANTDLTFSEYVYNSLPVTYPVLTDVTSLTGTLQSIRTEIDHARNMSRLTTTQNSFFETETPDHPRETSQ